MRRVLAASWVQHSSSLDGRPHLNIPQGILPGAFLDPSFYLLQIWLVAALWPQFPNLCQRVGGSSVAVSLSGDPFCDPLGWALGRGRGGRLGQRAQEWEPHPPTSPARTLVALHQNGRVPVFASDGRNVTAAAALSTLGGNSVWLQELALSTAKLPAAGVWVGRLANWPGWGQPLCGSPPSCLSAPQASPPSAVLKFLGGGGIR